MESGAAFVFERDDNGTPFDSSDDFWAEQARLSSPAQEQNTGDHFGYAVAISGDSIVVGVIFDNPQGSDSGSAYVFTRSGSIRTEQQRLLATGGALGDRFGNAVDIDGDTVVVGALSDDNANGTNAGAAYVFTRSGSVWTQQQQLLAGDGQGEDLFGEAVSISGNTIAVGARLDDHAGGTDAGSVYMFEESGGTWTETQRLTSGGNTGPLLFGFSVSLDEDSLAVGFIRDFSGVADAGSVHVFTRPAGTWNRQQVLYASDAATGDEYGYSVALSGDTLLVGSRLDSDGSAYVYGRLVDHWVEAQKLVPGDLGGGDNFGNAVALADESAWVGAWRADVPSTNAGAAYSYVVERAVTGVHVDPYLVDGGVVTLRGVFEDPGTLDEYDVTVDWDDPQDATDSTFEVDAIASLSVSDTFISTSGDGAVLTVSGLTGDTVSFQVQRQYPGDNFIGDLSTIDVSVADDDTGLAADSATVNRTFGVTNTLDSGSGSLRQAILDANANPGLDAIVFDIAGNGPHTIAPTSALPDITGPVTIDGTTEPNFAGTPVIELRGDSAGVASGLQLNGTNTTLRGLVINRFDGHGIRITGNDNTIVGNYIGTDVGGTVDLGNSGSGVSIEVGMGNVVGGGAATGRNVISGNDVAGVRITGPTTQNNLVQGNLIGTDATGAADLGNANAGIKIINGAQFNVIGTNEDGVDDASEGNVVSGNDNIGIEIDGVGSSGNTVAGNYIGTNATGIGAIGNSGTGVFISAPGNRVGGTTPTARNVVSGNGSDGISFRLAGSGNLVQGNYVGINVTGTAALGNAEQGIDVNAPGNTIGGSAPGAGNVVSGNADTGVFLTGAVATGNIVQGNRIGTDASGLNDLGNGGDGVGVENASGNQIGGTAAGAGNVISGNSNWGLFIQGTIGTTNNVAEGNVIGLDADADDPIRNDAGGVHLGGPNNRLGGIAAGAGNIVSGNLGTGVVLAGATSTGNLVQGNLIGTDGTGLSARGNTANGIAISGGANLNTIGGTTATPGSGAGNVISGNTGSGVLITGLGSDSNVVSGNIIGLNATGDSALGLGNGTGVRIEATAVGNTIGGSTTADRNVISGNTTEGIIIHGAGTINNQVLGNYVGVAADGFTAAGNFDGVYLDDASNNVVGSPGAGNVISGNTRLGVVIQVNAVAAVADSNVVQANLIGTDANGTLNVGNTLSGVFIGQGTNNVIGGTAPGERNVISGNRHGVSVVGSDAIGNTIQGNYIGINVSGSVGLGNSENGVAITDGANNNFVGGTVAGAGNVISANGVGGVRIEGVGSDNNLIAGNRIGTNAAGTQALGNFDGIYLNQEAASNVVGGTSAGATNLISGNSRSGVVIADGSENNRVEGNRIGTDVSGKLNLGNVRYGVDISRGTNNIVGGATPGARNVISGNNDAGVIISGSAQAGTTGNVVMANYIGPDVTGTVSLGNSNGGIVIEARCDEQRRRHQR